MASYFSGKKCQLLPACSEFESGQALFLIQICAASSKVIFPHPKVLPSHRIFTPRGLPCQRTTAPAPVNWDTKEKQNVTQRCQQCRKERRIWCEICSCPARCTHALLLYIEWYEWTSHSGLHVSCWWATCVTLTVQGQPGGLNWTIWLNIDSRWFGCISTRCTLVENVARVVVEVVSESFPLWGWKWGH